jgi:hypothetical protein
MRNFEIRPLRLSLTIVSPLFFLISPLSFAHEHAMSIYSTSPDDCSDMEYYDIAMTMCMPLPMEGMPMTMLMVRGNAFATYASEQGSRGRDDFAAPNMFMADLGTTLGDHHYFNLDYMGTLERWTFPSAGYPELLQIGEVDQEGRPFIDAQHPHSSPIMGLTLSDTIAWGQDKDNIKLFFAPRGEATEGPIAFMHRSTGMVNPDAPLGHHIGQDVAHISSTVIGASLKLGSTRLEASGFNGTEPDPEKVDLPIGTPNSVALRVIEEFSPDLMGMVSASHVRDPEPDEPEIHFENRYSTSFYLTHALGGGWRFEDTLIYGMAQNYDHATLSSFTEEFVFRGIAPRIWGRLEALQRTAEELEIPTAGDPHSGKWVGAVTLGYTHRIASLASNAVEIGIGGAVTKDFLPGDFIGSYGGNPWSGKVFLQIGGLKMFDLGGTHESSM